MGSCIGSSSNVVPVRASIKRRASCADYFSMQPVRGTKKGGTKVGKHGWNFSATTKLPTCNQQLYAKCTTSHQGQRGQHLNLPVIFFITARRERRGGGWRLIAWLCKSCFIYAWHSLLRALHGSSVQAEGDT